jgi:cbb3-type cytochrome oxidase maturation protein
VEVLILTVFVSALLVLGELVFFAWNIKSGNHDHVERLSLLPLDQDAHEPTHARLHVSETRTDPQSR